MEETERRNWLREIGIYALLYGVPFVLLFPYTGYRPDAEFHTSLRTQTVNFTLGEYDKAGFFAGSLVDVTFEHLDHVQLPTVSAWKRADSKRGEQTNVLPCNRLRFRNVKLQSLNLPVGTSVRMEWYELSPTGVRLVLNYQTAPQPEAAKIFLGDKSVIEFDSCQLSQANRAESGEIDVSGAEAGVARLFAPGDLSLGISITPLSPEPHKSAALPTESNLPLLSGTGITFLSDKGESTILGMEGNLQVSNADRKEQLTQGHKLTIKKLRDHSRVTTIVIKDGIAATIDGRAGTLTLDDNDARPSPAEYLRAQKILSTWLATVTLIGTAGLTVASRIKLVKLDRKGS